MKVGDLVGRPAPTRKWGASDRLLESDVFLGIEIELEGMQWFSNTYRNMLDNSGLWRITEDGSLRNSGLEFITQEVATRQPLMGADIVRALDTFKDMITKASLKKKAPELSERTSVHVHLDVRDFNPDELKRFILLYYTFEEILFNWIGSNRSESSYCRPAYINQDVIERASAIMNAKSDSALQSALRGNKYDALNYAALHNYGSLEVRSMRGTFDTEEILVWVNILLSIRSAARNPEINVDDFPEQASASGIATLLTKVFDESLAVLLAPHATSLDILRGVRVAQEIMMEQTIRSNNAIFQNRTEDLTAVNLFKTTTLGV